MVFPIADPIIGAILTMGGDKGGRRARVCLK